MNKNADLFMSGTLAALVAGVCLFTGPGSFDAMDGAELAVAGMRLEISHSPGYPLLMWILRVSGRRSYQDLRLVTCLISGLAAGCVFLSVRSFGAKRLASMAASLLFVSSAVVMAELNILEVHGLSLLLASAAIALRNTPLGPYAFGMSVFGGHPLSVFLLPMVISRMWLKRSYLALIPATIWLYVPLRAPSASVMHYGGPATLEEFYHYLSMYGGRITAITFSGVGNLVSRIGALTLGVFIAGTLMSRFCARTALALLGILAVFFFYRIPDICAYSWIVLLPVTVVVADGFQRIIVRHRIPAAILITTFVAASVFSGINTAVDNRNDSMEVIVSDLFRGIPHERVFCSTGGTSYYIAYMMENEDMRPDLLAIDTYGIVHSLSLIHRISGGIPSEFGGRPVHATAAWGVLPPSGILFSIEERVTDWSIYDVFSADIKPSEEMVGDMIAEIWCIRALQEESNEAAFHALEKAAEYAVSENAVSAVAGIAHCFHEGLCQ